ncbi:MAG: hypothetical protein J6X78_05935 [Treponema sp.]|nr:hypothetical protein [Treponema sp.]
MRCNLHDADIMEDGIAIGEARGEKRGRTEAKLEAARKLINLGISLDIIAQAQDLPLETVQKLADELKVVAAQ